jgi:Protein of unknown function (DUF2752)
MALFSYGMPRWLILLFALAAFCAVSPGLVAHGPNLCIWSGIFHLAACPACGSTRALVAFFHGQFASAIAFNRNVVITAPGLVILLALDILQVAKRFFRQPRSGFLFSR